MTPRTAQRWLNAYLEWGLDGLAPRKARRREPAIPSPLVHEIRCWAIDGPVT
jgi:hypothetical protein